MSTKRTAPPKGLKLLPDRSQLHAVPRRTEDVLGGVGLDWSRVPTELAGPGRAAWEHLGRTFARVPTRFREADRQAVASYCTAVEQAAAATAALREHGVLVPGRSEADHDRPVRSPAWAMWRDASTAVRQWSAELVLSPSARARARLADDEHRAGGASSPFFE